MKTTECTSECARGVGRSVHSTFVFPHHLGVLALGRSAVFERSVSKLNDSRVSFLRGRFAGIGQ